MSKDNLITFTSTDNKNEIKFGPEINKPYFKLTAFNILKKLGYEISIDGVKDFQMALEIDITGKIDINTFTQLIFAVEEVEDFDRQYAINRLTEAIKEYNDSENKKKKKETRDNIFANIVAIILLMIFIVGVITCFKTSVVWIREIFNNFMH